MDATLRQEDEARALGQRLFFDRRGPLPLYPHSLYSLPDRPRTSCSGLSDDPDDPPRLLLRLEATAAGCQWLLDRWAELGALLDRGLSWQSPDKLRAIRLLGHQPLDAADSQVVATIFQACHVLDPQPHHQARIAADEAGALTAAIRTLKTIGPGGCARLCDQPGGHDAAESQPDEELDEPVTGELDEDEEAEARLAWQRCGAAFGELLGELNAEEGAEYRRRLEGRRVDELRPLDPAAARGTLRGIVEKAVIRLEAKRDVHAAHDSLEAVAALDRLSFDESAEGERLRRFQLAGQRALLRTVDSLMKLRRIEPMRQAESEPGESAATVARLDRLTATTWLGPGGIHSCIEDDLLPAVPDRPAGPPSAPEPEHGAQHWLNEPTAAADDPPGAVEESTATIGAHRILTNEPTAPAGEHPIVTDEPTPSPADRCPHPGPAEGRRSESPPPKSAHPSGRATDVATKPAATPTRSADREHPLPPASKEQPQARPGQRAWVDEHQRPGNPTGCGDPGA